MSDKIPLDTGDAIILTGLGSRVIRLEPTAEIGLLLDLEGRLNKLDIVDAHRYIMTAGQAAELIADVIVSGQAAASEGSDVGGGGSFLAELDRSLKKRQQDEGLE